MVERRVSEKKAADSQFDSRTGKASVSGWKEDFTGISNWGKAVYPSWSPVYSKRYAKKSALRQGGQTDAQCLVYLRNKE